MCFSELARARCSIRGYEERAVPTELLDPILEAARLAPTAANRQPFRLYVIPTAGRAADLARLYKAPWFREAPLVIGICADREAAWTRSDGVGYGVVDATIAMDHLILAAADLGLGTCWIAAFDPAVARELLALPPNLEPVAFTPLGFPAGAPRPKRRKELAELVVRLPPGTEQG